MFRILGNLNGDLWFRAKASHFDEWMRVDENTMPRFTPVRSKTLCVFL